MVTSILYSRKPRLLASITPGNPKRATTKPTTEMMLKAFEGQTLSRFERGGQKRVRLTPLSKGQTRILELIGLSPEIYLRLAQYSSEPVVNLGEP